MATLEALMASRQEFLLGSQELEAGAEAGILLQIILVRVVLRAVHQFEPSVGEVRIELGMVGGILLNQMEVGLVCDEGNICSQSHGLGKFA